LIGLEKVLKRKRRKADAGGMKRKPIHSFIQYCYFKTFPSICQGGAGKNLKISGGKLLKFLE
jgi:hypothetical protein